MATMPSWFNRVRIPEPEVMDRNEEIAAYISSTAESYLQQIDQTFVEQALSLGILEGNALDVGTGSGQILINLSTKAPDLYLTGVDLSSSMITRAKEATVQAGLANKIHFQQGDAKCLPFGDNSFNMVLCNSLLHHTADPLATLNELSRVCMPQGAILLRDLRRPSRFLFPLHAWWFGRHYSGLMNQLYQQSLGASYSQDELEELLLHSHLSGAKVFQTGLTHIGIQRSAKTTYARTSQL